MIEAAVAWKEALGKDEAEELTKKLEAAGLADFIKTKVGQGYIVE